MTPTPACHNCRRQRLKCDKSIPSCLKCSKRGVECLGYGIFLRWESGMASRGAMMGRTFQEDKGDQPRKKSGPNRTTTIIHSIEDPLVQDLDGASLRYLHYFATDVCKDLVLYDKVGNNPFRELIPLSQSHPVLLNVMIANAALHMSNAYQKSAAANPPLPLTQVSLGSSIEGRNNLTPTSIQQVQVYKDSLVAKQRALRLLRSSLSHESTMNVDVTLAVVLLLIECELIDSGRQSWSYHVAGARPLIDKICRQRQSTTEFMSPIRKCLVSNCLVFDILGSTLSPTSGLMSDALLSEEKFSLLQDAEGNHCSSMPAILLRAIQKGAQIFHDSFSAPDEDCLTIDRHQRQLILLIHTAQSFDALKWARSLQASSPAADTDHRKHVATAHRAAVCLYLCRVLLFICPKLVLPYDLNSLAAEIISHLAIIKQSDALFTATTWPAFVAGAETNDATAREWATKRFQELWDVEPWGLMKGAQEALVQIWAKKMPSMSSDELKGDNQSENWLVNLRLSGADWLII